MIYQIIKDLSNSHLFPIPTAATKLLQRKEKTKYFNDTFHYQSIIGKLNYLDKGKWPDIFYATHQCARFCEDSKILYVKVVEYIVGYLKKTRNKGIALNPNKNKLFEVYADLKHFSNWNKSTVEFDASKAKSRTRF